MSEDDERLRSGSAEASAGSTSAASSSRLLSGSAQGKPFHVHRSKISSKSHHHPTHLHHHQQQHYHQHQQLRHRKDAGKRVSYKYRQVYIRSLQQQEYNKLLNIVPALASSRHKQRIPKVTVIEETIRYIDQLHEALAERVESETGGRLKVTTEAVAEAAKDMFVEDATAAAAAAASGSAAAGAVPSSSVFGAMKCNACDTERSASKKKDATCADT